MTKVTCICRSAKKKVVTCSILFLFLFFIFYRFCCGVFWAFRNKGSSKTRKKNQKVHLGSSQKMQLFFPFFSFFLPSVVDVSPLKEQQTRRRRGGGAVFLGNPESFPTPTKARSHLAYL
jgi:hypothetical protein